MKLTIFFMGIILNAMLFTACNEAPEEQLHEHVAIDLDQLKVEFQSMENAYAEALNTGDIDAIMAYYGDDIISYSNNEPMVSGKEAFRIKQEEDMAETTPGTTYAFEVMDVFAEGDMAVETGKTTITVDGNVTRTGKYMCLFLKRNGKYECVREMYNDDKKEL